MLSVLWAKIRFAYTDPLEEKEYCDLKASLNTNFSQNLLLGITLLSILVTVYFFILGLKLDSYLALAFNIFGALSFLFRKRVGSYIGSFSIIYVCFLVTNTLVHMPFVLSTSSPKDVFYMGYSFALMTKLVDFRVNKFYIALTLHIIFIIARSLVIVPETIPQGVLTTSLDVLPIILSFNAEKTEKLIFDMIYKSKNLLLKFKQLLTEYPNPIAVITSDCSQTLFVNDVFKKAFGNYDSKTIKEIIENLIIDKQQNTEEHKNLLLNLINLNYDNEDNKPLRLSEVLQLFGKNKWVFDNSPVIGFQVMEQDVEEEDTVINNLQRNRAKKGTNTCSNPQANKSLRVPVFEFSRQVLKPEDSSETEKSRLEVNKKDMDATTTTPFITPKNNSSSKYKQTPTLKDPTAAHLHQENSNRIFKIKIFPLTWDGQEAITIVLDDVTYERTIMELKIADKNKDLVIAMVSHELRTPINGMLGLMEMMRKEIIQPELMIYLNACKASTRLLLNLIDSILDFSQIKYNTLKLVYSRVIICDLLAEIKSLFDHFCQMKGLFLEIENDSDVPQVIITDQTRLSQILINLIGNAFKFTVKGGVTVKVSLTQSTPNRVKFSVIDTGIGMRKEDQENLKMFGRLEQHDKKVNTQGVLLGLTIANDLATLLNSNEKKGIQVESEFGKGTTVSFCIQLETREKLTEGTVDKNDEEESSFESITHSELASKSPLLLSQPLNSRNILPQYSSSSISNIKNTNNLLAVPKLGNDRNESKSLIDSARKRKSNKVPWCLVVDDNPFNLMIAINTMKERGFQVKTALAAQEAISIVKEQNNKAEPISVILMDCQMPVMDGYEASRILTQMMRDGEVEECPIIALTVSNQDKEHEKLCNAAGMSACVQKPLNGKELEEVLQRLGKLKE